VNKILKIKLFDQPWYLFSCCYATM